MPKTPAITGKRLLKLLEADGWKVTRRARHGLFLSKRFSDVTRITVVKDTKAIIPPGTLSNILGPKQTGLGKTGLRRLIK